MPTKFDYTRAKATAERLIDKFGQAGKIRRVSKTGPAHNPTTTETDHDCVLVDLDFADTLIDGSTIKRSDRKVYLSTAGLSITPSITTDRIVIGGAAHDMVNIKPLSPAGAVVFWEIQARR